MKKLPDQLWKLHPSQADEFRAAVDWIINGRQGRSIRDLANYWGFSTSKARMIMRKYGDKNTPKINKNNVVIKKDNTIQISGHVRLTRENCDKLIAEYGKEDARGIIDTLDAAIEAKGYKYKSHMGAIRSWAADAYFERKARKNGRTTVADTRELEATRAIEFAATYRAGKFNS